MAHDSQLPCDGDGVCMLCKKKPSDEETLTCKTCVTPWHVSCLSIRPQTLASTLEWECPDCSLPTDHNHAPVPGKSVFSARSETSGDLIAAIRAIEADQSLTELEKAKRRQELMSRAAPSPDPGDAKSKKRKMNGENDVLDLLDGSFNCSFCMQLPERPVTSDRIFVFCVCSVSSFPSLDDGYFETPCGHNFCLKCFQKWVGQGKRTCAKCRNTIPPKMASQPRINASLVVAIRMAKMSKSICTGGSLNVYHFVHNQNRPDKAFTTERAKKAGKANACSGKIFVTTPPDHFGPILAENDPDRKQGVLVGESWEDRMECRQWGAHLPHVAGIAGQSEHGAQSVALSGGYEDDEDHGEWFLYTGRDILKIPATDIHSFFVAIDLDFLFRSIMAVDSGGRDLSGNKRTNKEQSFDQKFEKMNEALRVSCKRGYPVRVVRSHKEKRSCYAPENGVRYDGIYRIEKCWRKAGIQGFKVCRYLFVRCDNDPAPWTSDELGDRPRPLPVIQELKKANDITERKESPSWDYDEEEGSWKWKKLPPLSKKPVDTGNPEDRKRAWKSIRQTQNLSVREKLLKEFSCLICRKVMTLPLTTPCAHNFCKPCLEGAFSGQTFVRKRTCEGRRTLREQKNLLKCPSCPNDISDFLQNPQVNRELMDVIELLQRKTEENSDNVELSSEQETDGLEEKPSAASGDTEMQNPPTDSEPTRTCKQKKTVKFEIPGDSKNLRAPESKKKSEENYDIEKPDVAGDAGGVGIVNSETIESGHKGMQNLPTESKPKRTYKRKKADGRGKSKTSAEEKPDDVHGDTVNAVKSELPKGDDKDLVPVIENKLKRTYKWKKAKDGNCLSRPYVGVKTRSKKAQEAADEGNDSPSSPLHIRSDDDDFE
ncbi:hypothetical protein HHK36_015955 [Tetracentron sinense]|uniref:RING-type E3 ubiquitin transferase n=1 Tax=Tetracentron sinense TaxID=13715 RepID=A0A834Z668_TETSI|nr:hypothetical protein HHK36_015955 [Tetracentron sinense]